MIKIVKNGNVIKVLGHAGFDDFGKDIVCASVSSIIYTTINGILNLDKKAISFTDNGQEMTIKVLKIGILKDDETVLKLINNMLELINDLSIQYPKNIKMECEKY